MKTIRTLPTQYAERLFPMTSLLKRLLIEFYCLGWISRDRLDRLFERWPSLRGA